ncbi:MAG: flavodoxin family protein [Desulfovermiculus sp.]
MKITSLLGSARKHGNTAIVLGWVEDELATMGHEVQSIYLNSLSIHGCLGCGKCKENPDAVACVQDDDGSGVLETMISSDLVLFASPLYFWGFTAQIKAIIDRSYALTVNYHRPGHTSLMAGKGLGLLATGGGPFENNAEGMFAAFDRLTGFFLAQKQGELYIGGCTDPSELTAEVRQKALGLARILTNREIHREGKC